jgi:hypothetical protein
VRLACFGFSARGAVLRWTHQLEAPAVGDPVVAGGVVYLASGAQVVRVGVVGSVLPALPLPAVASAPAAAAGDRVAVGCADGSVLVFANGAVAWSSPASAPPTAVAVSAEAVYAAIGNGSVTAFAP